MDYNLFSSYKDPLELADICIEDSEDQFDFINKISEAKAETMMRRGVDIEKLYPYTEWETDIYKQLDMR